MEGQDIPYAQWDQRTPGNAEFRGSVITWKQHDRRTPGKFKEEYRGVGMACINSKTYIIWKALNPQGSSETKASAKSVQQKKKLSSPRRLQKHYTWARTYVR